IATCKWWVTDGAESSSPFPFHTLIFAIYPGPGTSQVRTAMTRFSVALLVGGLCAVPGFGASPDPKDLVVPPQEISRARELVRKLGSEVYKEREDAHAELVKMGRTAKVALLEGATGDNDPEVRFRCSRLLPRAGADDLKARLDTFLADTEGKFEHDLP